MTKPLPKPNVQVAVKRTGPPRLTSAERQQLLSIEDPTLKKVMGEIFIAARANQDNFDEITQWFPIQPADAAYAVKDQIVFGLELREGYLEKFDSEQGVIEFLDEGGLPNPDMEHIEKVRFSLNDLEERGVGLLLQYIASIGAGAHRGLCMMVGQESGAFVVFELTSATSGGFGSLYREADCVPIVAGPSSPDFIYGEQVALFSIGAVQGEKGADGAAGAEGRWASLAYEYLTNTEETEPGAGGIKFNAGKTLAMLRETDKDGGGVGAYLAAWDDSTTTGTRGFIVVRKVGTPATFAIYKVTGALVDKGTWDTLPVELVASNGAFANTDRVSVEFYRTGDKGEKGDAGTAGKDGKDGADGAPGAEGAKGDTGGQLAFNAFSSSAAGTGNLEWEHDPAGESVPRGILVLIVQNAGATDEVTSVKYGTEEGATIELEELPNSPFLHTLGSEDGVVYAYFAGRGIPSSGFVGGTMGVKVTVSGASSKRAVCYSIDSDDDLTAATATEEAESAANPGTTIDQPVGVEGLVFGALHSGHDAVSSVAVISIPEYPVTEDLEHDFGSQTAYFAHRGAVFETSFGWLAGAEEYGLMLVAVREVQDFGLVTALPTKASRGDVCRYVADKTNGVLWQLVYTNENATYPWNKIGGPPIQATSSENPETTSAAYQTSGAPSVTAPLKMQARVTIGVRDAITQTLGKEARVGAFVDGVDTGNLYTNANVSGGVTIPPPTLIASGKAVQARYKSDGTNPAKFWRLFVEIDPIRVG